MNPDSRELFVGHVIRCFGCAARDREERKFIDGKGDPSGIKAYSERR